MYLDTKKILKTTDFQRNYNWEFILPGTVSTIDNMKVSAYIQEVQFGQYNFQDFLTVRQGPFETRYPGSMSIKSVLISILSPSNSDVIQFFLDWRNKIVDDAGFHYPKINYAFSSYCYLYNTKGNSMGGFKLINTFPKTFPDFKLTYKGNGEIVEHNIELNVDFIERI